MYEGSLCVSCMSTDDLVELFVSRKVNNVDENYAKMLTSCLNVQISETDGHDSICESCTSKLRDCVSFKRQTLKTMSILLSFDITELVTVEDVDGLGLEDHTEKDVVKCVAEDTNNQKLHDTVNRENPEKTQIEKDLNENIDDDSSEPIRVVVPKRKRGKVGRPRVHTPDYFPYRIAKDELLCRVCGMLFANNVTLKVHLHTHFGAHACRSCDKSFMTRQSLNRHETTHLVGPFACDTCKQEFHSLNTLRSHKRYKHGSAAPYPCRGCDAHFATFQRRVDHEASAHGRTERRHACPYCDKRFSHSGQRARHISDQHEIKMFPCPLCGAKFRRTYLRTHLLRMHGMGSGYECTVCLLMHPSPSSLAKHMLSHFDDRRFVCKLCSKAFVQKVSLKYHIGSHIRRGQYSGDPNYLMVYREDPKDAKDTGLLSEKEDDADEQYLDESLLSDQSAEDKDQDTDYQSLEDQSIVLTDNIEGIDGMLLDDERFQLPSDLA